MSGILVNRSKLAMQHDPIPINDFIDSILFLVNGCCFDSMLLLLLLLLLLLGAGSSGGGGGGGGVGALHIVRVNVPSTARTGTDHSLHCDYDLNGTILYALRWYKDGQEFFRYMPKEAPAKRYFNVTGVHVNVTFSLSSAPCHRCIASTSFS